MKNDSFCHPLKGWFLKQKNETKLLFHSIPAVVVALFVISVVTMNILAGKTVYQNGWLAIDGGIFVSWLSFLCMDMITKHFGPKASIKITVFAMCVNLLVCLIFYVVSIIPAGEEFAEFDRIIGGTWYILLSSTIAFLSSGILNIILNYLTGKIFKKNPDGRLAFYTRTYVSTFIGQFFDNLIFAMLAFMVFFPIYLGFSWNFTECVMCSLLGALLELACEIIFSPFGFYVTRSWKKDGVGKEYIEFVSTQGEKV